MSQELIYTSATRGLKPGTRGFTTVACTTGMSKYLTDFLESLSGYKHIYAPGSSEAYLNPINYSCLRFTLGGSKYVVISRIADCGLDHTQRSNKIAHHLVLDTAELTEAGPAITMLQDSLFKKQWSEDPKILPANKSIEVMPVAPAICSSWDAVTGDAGWGGELARIALEDPMRKVHIIYPPGTDLLSLFAESQALLPSRRRWNIPFATYHTSLPPGVACSWRGILDGTPDSERVRRMRGELVFDLKNLTGKPADSELVEAARTGILAALDPLAAGDKSLQENPQVNHPQAAKTEPQGSVNESRIAKEAPLPPPMLPKQASQEFPLEKPLRSYEPGSGSRQGSKVKLIALGIGLVFVSLFMGVGVGALFFNTAERITSQANEDGAEEIAESSGNTQLLKSEIVEKLTPKDRGNSELKETLIGDPLPVLEKSIESGSKIASVKPKADVEKNVKLPRKANRRKEVEKPEEKYKKIDPKEFFIDFRDEVSLPSIIRDGVTNQSDFISPISLGKISSNNYKVDLEIAQSSQATDLFKIEKLPEHSSLWRIMSDQQVEVAFVRIHDREVTFRWSDKLSAGHVRAEGEMRSSFLVFRCRELGEENVIALREPFRVNQPAKFDDAVSIEKIIEIHQAANEERYSIPNGQALTVTGYVNNFPQVKDGRYVEGKRLNLEFNKSEPWELGFDSADSLKLVAELEVESQPRVKITLQYRDENQKNRYKDLDRKLFEKRLTFRGIATEEAIKNHEDTLWKDYNMRIAKNGSPIHPNGIHNEDFKNLLLNRFNQEYRAGKKTKSGLRNLVVRDLYEKWLREEFWQLIHLVDGKNIPYYWKNNELSSTKKMQGLNKKYPLDQLVLWGNVVANIESTEFHLRVTRHLLVGDAMGIDPPPMADVMVIGSPKR